MFIKRIIIDGFKSYKEKVVLDGFDDSFNAITGYNGSGKSNILDAVCFVLGLSRLDVARCTHLRDLIYKAGKAGVTSAKVTIELDNTKQIFDKLDWRHLDTISVSRTVHENNQSKFLINDRTVKKEDVLELFQSVKLNISNPHFLIMQGKVVKVSTMKPTEILSMIYEAIGVTIYETKRRHNASKINKCDELVKEYNFTMDQSIIPKLKQLKAEEKGLREYRQIENDIHKMTKISIAYSYLDNQRIVQGIDGVLEEIQNRIEETISTNTEMEEQEKAYLDEIEEIQSHLNDDTSKKLNDAKEEAKEVTKEYDSINTEKKVKAANLADEERKFKNKQTEMKDFQKKTDAMAKKFDADSEKFEVLKAEFEEKKKLFETTEQQLTALSKGQMANVDENSEQMAASVSEQLQNAKTTKLKAEKNIQHNKVLITKKEADLGNIRKDIDAQKAGSEGLMKEIEKHQKNYDKVREEMNRAGFDENKFNEVVARLRLCQANLARAQDHEKKALNQVPSAKFEYTKPSANFDEANVYGVVSTLFNVEDKRGYKAIEKIIGGRFFNVVVRNTKTATDILKASKLKERRTFLPIDSLKAFNPDRRLMSKIQGEYGEENVKYLIDLVSYEDRVAKAMTYVFRDVIICEGIDLANEISFKFQKKTVTYQGEVVDPRGYMTTSSGNKRDLLPLIDEMKAAQEEVKKMRAEINTLQFERAEFEKQSNRLQSMKNELEHLNLKFQESPYQLSLLRLGKVEKELEEIRQELQKDEELQVSQESLIEKLNDRLANFELYKARDEKELAEKKKKAEDALKKCMTKFENDQTKLDELRVQLESQKAAFAGLEEELAALEKVLDDIQEEINEVDKRFEEASEKQRETNAKVKALQKQQDAQSSEISKKRKKIEGLKKKISENNMTIKKLEIEIDDIKAKEKTAKKTLIRLKEKYDWIEEEEESFLSNENEYKVMNEQGFDFGEYQAKLKELSDKKSALSKHVNLKAVDMTGEQLQELDDLQEKSHNVQMDRRTLSDFMDNVEVGKETQVAEAWKKVSKHFGEIFSTLLPSATCRLEEVTPGNLKDGLKIRVALANMWKDSLMELSGGQRSLVALSLILALLKYNPAPLYVLDEVDAALDNSHTQNIGIMIKKYFTDSQFIVVSLKEGMFSNANVIFETSFVDGRSYVQRKN